jgi:hypothetical protein
MDMLIEDREASSLDSKLFGYIENNHERLAPGFIANFYISRMTFMLMIRFWFKNDVRCEDIMKFFEDNSDDEIDLKEVTKDEIDRNMRPDLVKNAREIRKDTKGPTQIHVRIFTKEFHSVVYLNIREWYYKLRPGFIEISQGNHNNDPVWPWSKFKKLMNGVPRVIEEIQEKVINRNFKIKLEMMKTIKLWSGDKFYNQLCLDHIKSEFIRIKNYDPGKIKGKIWFPIEKIIIKDKIRIDENNRRIEEENSRIIKSRIVIWKIDCSCFVLMWKKEKRKTIFYLYERNEKVRYDGLNTIRIVNYWMNKLDQKKYVEFTKERYSTWNWVNKHYELINILQDFNIFEEKVIISPQKIKLAADEGYIINGLSIGRIEKSKKNKLPEKKIKPITIKWTNQWKRVEDETIKLKPPDKIQDFELNEDRIHKRKIKLKCKQLNLFLNTSRSIILKIQEMLIWKDDLKILTGKKQVFKNWRQSLV